MNIKIFKYYLLIFLLLILSVFIYYRNLNISIPNTTDNYLDNAILSDSVIDIQIPFSNKYKIIGIVSPNDCSSCYSLLLNEFNNLLNNGITDSVVFYVLDQHEVGRSFKESLIFQYRPRFPIILLNKSLLPNNSLIWFLKTPLFIQINKNGEQINILQVNINNQHILFSVIDNIIIQTK